MNNDRIPLTYKMAESLKNKLTEAGIEAHLYNSGYDPVEKQFTGVQIFVGKWVWHIAAYYSWRTESNVVTDAIRAQQQ